LRSISFYLALFFLFVALFSPSASAVEVSELTVDFPLADVLNITPGTEQEAGQEGRPVAAASPWKAPWEDDWFAFRQRSVRGDLAEAKKSLDRIHQYRLNNGIPNLYLPAAALLVDASVAREQSRYQDALDIIDYAGKLAPDDPASHFLRARTKWSQNQLRALGSLDALLQGLMVFFKDFRSLFPWSIGLVLWILFGVLAASIITVILVALQVLPRLFHDLSHLVKVPQWTWYLVFPVFLISLLLSGMAFVVWVLLLSILMVIHLNSKERVVLSLAVFLLVSIPLIIHVFALGNAFHSGGNGLTLYTAERGGEGLRALDEINDLRVRDPRNSKVISTLALVMRRGGKSREAESLLRQAMDISPESPLILNNLANVLLNAGKEEQAIELYRLALKYDDDPRIHYNLSQALRENLQLDEGEREFLIAQEKDPKLTGSLASGQKDGDKRITVDIFSSLTDYLKGALKITDGEKVWRENLWSGVVPRVPFRFGWLIFPLASIILFVSVAFGRGVSTAERCRQCSRLHCRKCSEASQEVLCAQCRHIFQVRTGVDPASRVKKMMHIMRFKKRRALLTRIMTILLPGTGHLLLDYGWRSLIMIAISMFFWTKWILWHGLFRSTTMLEIQPAPVEKILFFVLFGIYYLIALRSVGKRLEEV
jgi:tetratricopeptide (TPR) repeat protein